MEHALIVKTQSQINVVSVQKSCSHCRKTTPQYNVIIHLLAVYKKCMNLLNVAKQSYTFQVKVSMHSFDYGPIFLSLHFMSFMQPVKMENWLALIILLCFIMHQREEKMAKYLE
jgi:hypothetical protein